jgi:hypothetical protein
MKAAIPFVLLLCATLPAQEIIEVGKVLSSRVVSTSYENADKSDAELRAEGFTPDGEGGWVKMEWLDKKSEDDGFRPLGKVKYQVPRFTRDPRYPILSGAMAPKSMGAGSSFPKTGQACLTGNCPTVGGPPASGGCAACNGQCGGNCTVCGGNCPECRTTTDPGTGRPTADNDDDHGDILGALKLNKELLEALRTLIDPKADRTDLQGAIDMVIANQAKLLQALTEMVGSGGGDSTELAIAIQRNTGELGSLVSAIQSMDGNIDGVFVKLDEVLIKLSDQAVELQGLRNEITGLRDDVTILRAGQKEFDLAMKEFEIKLTKIENGQFRFKMTIDPKTGKVIASDPSKTAGE